MRQTYLSPPEREDELQVYHYGMEVCEPGHAYGPAVRDHFLVHFIRSGRGMYQIQGKEYSLHADQGFLIPPWDVTFYQADADEPWEYWWVGFQGTRAAEILERIGLHRNTPIVDLPSGGRIYALMEDLVDIRPGEPGSDLHIQGQLCLILAELQAANQRQSHASAAATPQEHYVQQALEYIARNYSRQIRVTDITAYVGLNRSYFANVFCDVMNVSPRTYLLHYRMQKAAELLISTSLNVGDIARSVGYTDPLTFSRAFKRVMQYAPQEFRAQRKRKST